VYPWLIQNVQIYQYIDRLNIQLIICIYNDDGFKGVLKGLSETFILISKFVTMKGDQYIRGQHLLGSQYQTYLVDHTLHRINSINFELIDKPLYF